jgi:hypothetical protein
VPILLWLMACSPEEKEDTSPVEYIDQGGDTGPDCGGVAPVINSIEVGNGGIRPYEGVDMPSLAILINVSDEDSDLRPVRFDLWWDTTVDDTVDLTIEGLQTEPYVVSDREDCEVERINYTIHPAVTGDQFAFDALYEFAAIAYDAMDMASEVKVGVGYSPKADGTDGGAR